MSGGQELEAALEMQGFLQKYGVIMQMPWPLLQKLLIAARDFIMHFNHYLCVLTQLSGSFSEA